MNNYEIIIEFLSDTHIGSGQGYGAIIDSDIIFDKMGLPYIPAKRIKGLIKDSAIEICEMFELSSIESIPLTKDKNGNYDIIEKFFGTVGKDNPSNSYISNFQIQNYKQNEEWLNYFKSKYSKIVTQDSILSTFTTIRNQITIDENGVTKEGSLRTLRVVNSGAVFSASATIENDENLINLLTLACSNLRHIGTKRSRGLGEIKCTLALKENVINTDSKLEELCIK